MANGDIIKELHDLSKQDPRNVPAYTFRQVMMASQAKVLERQECLIEKTNKHDLEIAELKNLKTWDRLLAIVASLIAAALAAIGLA